MKKLLGFFAFIALLAGINSCKNDLDVLAPYKESVVIYGLLDHTDTINYIRVNKIFLGEGDATYMAQNSDSVYFNPGELSVKLERIKNGGIVSVTNPASSSMKIDLRDTLIPLQAGNFNTQQRIYYTKHPLYNDSEYKLTVTNNKTGKVYTSQTKLIANFQVTCGGQTEIVTYVCKPYINIPTVNTGKVKIVYKFPVNSRLTSADLVFYYRDTYTSAPTVQRNIHYILGTKKSNTTAGSEDADLTFFGNTFYGNIKNSIYNDPNVDKRFADSIQFVLTAAGEEYNYYTEVNGNSSGIVTEKPIYTNIQGGGIGLFSARAKYKLTKRLNCVTLDNLGLAADMAGLKFGTSVDYPVGYCL